MRILLTGGSGFIGSHAAEAMLGRGWEVWCAVRRTSSRRFLGDSRLHLLETDFEDEAAMEAALQGLRFDAVVHAAGATKCVRKSDFHRYNTLLTARLVSVLQRLALRDGASECESRLPRFVFLSSLSAINSIEGEALGKPTAYGASKREAEKIVEACRLPWVILRPTGVYGPRERDYLMMVQTLCRHIDFAAGFSPQHITFVYVTDVVQAIMRAVEGKAEDVTGHIFTLSDGETYTSRDFSRLIAGELSALKGSRHRVLRVTAPLFVLRAVCRCGDIFMRVTGKAVTLNNDKYNILSQRDWRCDISASRRLLGFRPEVKLAEGVRRTVRWYRQNGWI